MQKKESKKQNKNKKKQKPKQKTNCLIQTFKKDSQPKQKKWTKQTLYTLVKTGRGRVLGARYHGDRRRAVPLKPTARVPFPGRRPLVLKHRRVRSGPCPSHAFDSTVFTKKRALDVATVTTFSVRELLSSIRVKLQRIVQGHVHDSRGDAFVRSRRRRFMIII